MEFLCWLATFLLVFLALAYWRTPRPLASALFAGAIVLWQAWGEPPVLVAALSWLVFLAVAIPLNVNSLRRRLISDPVRRIFRRVLPTMSSTEREALEAGTVWWEGELFSGRPDWRKLLELPSPGLSAEEQAFLDGPVEELCRLTDDWRITEELHDLPPEVWQYIRENGFFGMIIPKEYGGLGFSALAHSCVVMKIATRSTTVAVTVMVPNSLGPAELLLHYGTDAQKQYYLPRLARGEEIPCFALTGPEAGSDASAIPDNGVVCRGEFEGQEVLGIRLNWEKRYITLGPVATVLGLAFKLYDPDRLLGEQESLGITLALIPTDTPGIEIGQRHFPLNIPFQNGPNTGTDVFIPMEWVIGGAERVGQGWRMLMESLAAGRSISLPALSTGAGKLAARATGAYARIRKQFKLPIAKFEGVEEALVRIAGNAYLMDAARMLTTVAVDQGEKPSVVSAIVKYHLTERMRQVINDAMDIQGGTGICLGRRNLIGRVYQAIPISITVEGANILTRTLIIFGQGAVRCHPYVLREMQAVQMADEDAASVAFDEAIFGHIGFTLGNVARALFLALGGARLIPVPGDRHSRGHYRQLSRMSAVFALAADFAMLTLGGSLKRKEKLSGRLADILSCLYLASAALKRYEDDGRPADDVALLHWSCEDTLFRIQEQFFSLLANFPNRPVAWLLHVLAFPLGRSYHAPSDALGHRVAQVLLVPSSARDRLTAGMFMSRNTEEAIGRIEDAFLKVSALEAIEGKLQAAVRAGELAKGDEETMLENAAARGVLDNAEVTQYRDTLAARRDVIQVDAYPRDFWQ